MNNKVMAHEKNNLSEHKDQYFVKNAVVYNLVLSLVVLAAGYGYLVQRFGLELLILVYQNPSFKLLFATCFFGGVLIGILIWFVMFFVPYVTLGPGCLSYKMAPLRRRRFIEYQSITDYKVSFMFVTLALASNKKVRIWLYGVTHKKAMLQNLSARLDRVIAAKNANQIA